MLGRASGGGVRSNGWDDANSEHAAVCWRTYRRGVRLDRRWDELVLRTRSVLLPSPPADGPEPNGVGSIREFASVASKVTEVVTGFERPRYMSYKALSTIPQIEHDGGSITFQEIPGGTEVFWTTTFRMTAPVLAGLLTRLYAQLFRMGMVSVTRTAERA